MWIIAAAVELLSAHKAVPEKIPLEPYREEELLEYIGESSNLLQSRLTSTQLTDFEGNIKEGLIFDAGV